MLSLLVAMDVLITFWKVSLDRLDCPALFLTPCAGDTTRHSWEILAVLLKSEETNGIVCDVGM